jgi:predicted DNA-binding protein
MSKTKRYTLVLPDQVFEQVEQLAKSEGTTIVTIVRKFIKLGLLVTEIQLDPDASIIIREGEDEKHLLIL